MRIDVTPKTLLNSKTNCFIWSVAVTSKQRVRVFKSDSKGTSSVDLQGLINKALDIDVTVYSNSDVARSPSLGACNSHTRDFKILERGRLEERLGRRGPGSSVRCSRREN